MIFSAYGVNFDSRMLDKILYIVDKNDTPQELVQSVLLFFLEVGTLIDSLDKLCILYIVLKMYGHSLPCF